MDLTLSLGGAVSGEHGDGLARSEWLERMYGVELMAAFRELKAAADPHGLLNPGKITGRTAEERPPAMDQDLRYGPDYRTTAWQPAMDFSDQAGLAGAIEQCNGAGVCRKAESVMCPSFQATHEEMHSTRGRANLLRAMIAGRFPDGTQAERVVYEAIDLCLACKGCKSECPSRVDMAKLKYEFLEHYYAQPGHRRRLRDYLFGYIHLLGRLGQPFAGLANLVMGSPLAGRLGERFFGLAHQRPFPQLARRSLGQQRRRLAAGPRGGEERVLFLADAFSEFFDPAPALAALRALELAGCQVTVLPVTGAGRTLISKGFVRAAQAHAARVVAAIFEVDPQGVCPVVGVEPSEIYTLRDEYRDLLAGDERVAGLAGRAWMIDDFLVRPGPDRKVRQLRIVGIGEGKKVLLHGHCYQKAQPPAADGYPTGVGATVAMLQGAGYAVEVVPSGCCGMAGAFGYEAEHYAVSQQVGELALLPAVRKAGADVMIAAAGVSCQAQIEDGTQREAVHPITLCVPAG